MKGFIKKLNFVDLIIVIGVIAVLIVGYITTQNYRRTADKQIEATSNIEFDVFLRGVTITQGTFPIKSGDNTFITIRNVPYTQLSVLQVSSEPRKVIVTTPKVPEQYILIKDPTQPSVYDAIVTIKDVAKITKDGAVVGGNKIKMGLPVTLEGETYKFNGIISNIKIMNDDTINDDGENNEVG